MSSAAIRVLVADDHAMVRQGIRAFLETQRDMLVVAEAADGDSALVACMEHAPQVLLLDLLMPGGGAAAAARIRAQCPQVRIVIVTSSEDRTLIEQVMRAGALSYVLKDLGPDALAQVVRKAAVGEAVLHPRAAERLQTTTKRPAKLAIDALSGREHEVLALVAEGLPNHAIATRLAIGEKTVKTHVSNVLAKLGCVDRTQAAVFAWRQGIAR